MAYKALYRKWRPDTFDTVIGQDHIVDTIRNEILSSHLAHAYLFTGTRGTGKTSTAKILSRAVNCLSPVNGNPCNECECCKNILNELSLDVMEIDAASNTGVDNIRDIIEQLKYLPSMGRYKVYIIDEVHMLSQGAFNALLKTLEEPPPHVIFILATTEVQKIPATILSRCQRFDFKSISIADIVSNIEKILRNEGINADYDALEYVAFLGDGSMRDSLSILDQCLAFKNDNLTVSDVTGVVGAIDDAVLYDFADDVAKCDLSSAMKRFNKCIADGKNFDNIVKGLLQVFRELLMFKINSDDFTVSKLKRRLLSKCADNFDIPSLVRYINILTDTIASFKTFSSQRVLCECALIKLTTPKVNTDFDSLLSRIDSLENKLMHLQKNPPAAVRAEIIDENMSSLSELEPPFDDYMNEEYAHIVPSDIGDIETKDKAVLSSDADRVIADWASVMEAVSAAGRIRIFTALYDAVLKSENGKLFINVDNDDKKHFLNEKANKELISECIKSTVGANVNIEIISDALEMTAASDDIFSSLDDAVRKFPSNISIN